VAACEKHKVRKLVYVSSMSVLDHAGHKPGVPVNEASPYEPHPDWRGLYTQTKLEAEKIVLDAAAKGRIHAVILRPGQIYGPGSEKTPPSGTIALAGRWLIVGNGRRMVPLVHVENVIDALLLAAERDLPNGTILQLVDPDGTSQRDYVDAVRRSRPVKPAYVPTWFIYCAAIGVEILGRLLKRGVPLSRYRVRSIRPLWPCDCTAAERQLGWRPRISVQEGLAQMFGPEIGPKS
jgi:nucleoside-diphosphate-sugar epimerase